MIRMIGVLSLVLGMSMMSGSGQIQSKRVNYNPSPDTDASSAFWRGASPIFFDRDKNGNAVAAYRTEVLSRWTDKYLYFLFICPYKQLNLKLGPKTDTETYGLWNWDVAEIFIGSNFKNIRRYREFEVSPQGEWTDLDINLDVPHHEDGWVWNSGFKVAARIDPIHRRWYGFMQIPYSSVDSRPARAGNRLRVNFFLSEGIGVHHQALAWQPTHKPTFHVPEVFGTLKLVN